MWEILSEEDKLLELVFLCLLLVLLEVVHVCDVLVREGVGREMAGGWGSIEMIY